MAWLGTNLASIKSQITNFTKEVLIEGSNEIKDPSEQLQLATNKIKEYEESCNSREVENERLRLELREYCERAESNEYQAKKISSQYRALLDTKEDEIARLKLRLEEMEKEKTPKKEKRVLKKRLGKQQEQPVGGAHENSSGECWSDWGDEVGRVSCSPPSSHDGSDQNSSPNGDSLLLLRQEIRALKERLNEQVEQRARDTAKLELETAQSLAQAQAAHQRALDESREECEALKENLYNALKSEGLHLSRISDLNLELDARSLQLKELESENESYRLVLAEKTKEIIEFKKLAELMQAHPDLETLAQQCQELQTRYEKLKEEKDAVTLEFKRFKESKAAPHHMHMAIQTDGSQDIILQQQLHQSEELLEQNAYEKSLIIRDRDNLLRENGIVSDKLLEAENEISLLEGENAELLDRYEELRERLYHLDPSITQRSVDGAEGEERDDDPTYQNDAYVKSRLPTAPIDKSTLLLALSNCTTLKARLATLAQEHHAQRQNYALNEREMQHKYRALNLALDGLRAAWGQENAVYKGKLSDLTTRLDASSNLCQDLKAENLDYDKRFTELQLKRETERAAIVEELAKLRAQADAENGDLKILQSERDRLKTDLMGRDQKIASLLVEVERHKESDAEVKILESAIRDGEEQRSYLTALVTQLQNRIQELERELGDKREEMWPIQETMNSIKSELGVRDALVERLQQELAGEREICELSKHKITLYQSICRQMQQGCQGFKLQLRDLKAAVLSAQQQALKELASKSDDPLLRSLVTTGFGEEKLRDFGNTISMLRAENLTLKSSLTTLTERANCELSLKEDRIKVYADSLERVERECAELKAASLELETMRVEIGLLKERNATCNTSIKMLEQELEKARTTTRAKSECVVASVQTEDMREKGVDNKIIAAMEMAYKEREDKMAKELDRLKGHLVKMEDSYTTEVFASEQREVSLKQALATHQEKADSLSNQLAKYESQNANKLKNLSENLAQITAQRDKCMAQNTDLQDDVCRLQSQITNLQLVLERVQKEKDDAISFEVRAITDRLEDKDRLIKDLQQKAERQEAEAKKLGTLSKSYSFLNQRLAERESALNEARLQLIDQESTINDLRERIGEMEKKQGTAFEKEIFKNLFASYLSTSDEKKHEIGFLMAKILGFSQPEIDKMNPINAQNSSSRWSFGLWGGSSPTKATEPLPNDSKKISDKGLSELFIQFLERESAPKNLPKFNLPQVDANQRGISDPFETNPGPTIPQHQNLQQNAAATINAIKQSYPQTFLQHNDDDFSGKFD